MKKETAIKSLSVLLFISFFSFMTYLDSIPALSPPNIPVSSDCSEQQIKQTWNSIFKQSSQDIVIKRAQEENLCSGYTAYKVVGNDIFLLSESKVSFYSNFNILNANRFTILPEKRDELFEYIESIDIENPENPPLQILATRNLQTPQEASNEYVKNFQIPLGEFTKKEFLIQGIKISSYVVTNNAPSTKISEAFAASVVQEYSHEQLSYVKMDIPFDICILNLPQLEFLCPDVVSAQEDCNEDWSCSRWSECKRGIRFRDCRDENVCNTVNEKPGQIEYCEDEEVCVEDWNCSPWDPATCEGVNFQTRQCTDTNDCKTQFTKPSQERFCEQPKDPEQNPQNWGAIFAGIIIALLLLIIIALIVTKENKK